MNIKNILSKKNKKVLDNHFLYDILASSSDNTFNKRN